MPGYDPGKPPGTWGGANVPMPDNPIANVPGAPGYKPPGGGGGGTGIWGPGDPRPNPPIANVPGVPGYTPPGGGGGQPAAPSIKWVYSGTGWYREIGPFSKPAPIPPELGTEGQWVIREDGVYFVSGPYDKPKPPGPVPPETPPVAPDAKAAWKYTDSGWYLTYGPFDKPQPPPAG